MREVMLGAGPAMQLSDADPLAILLVEDDHADARLFQIALQGSVTPAASPSWSFWRRIHKDGRRLEAPCTDGGHRARAATVGIPCTPSPSARSIEGRVSRCTRLRPRVGIV